MGKGSGSVTAFSRADGFVVIPRQREYLEADSVVVTSGAWTAQLVPRLASCFKTAGQPVFHLRPADPAPFVAERFPTFGADISTTGYYGFPLHPSGVVKLAHHGPGRAEFFWCEWICPRPRL